MNFLKIYCQSESRFENWALVSCSMTNIVLVPLPDETLFWDKGLRKNQIRAEISRC